MGYLTSQFQSMPIYMWSTSSKQNQSFSSDKITCKIISSGPGVLVKVHQPPLLVNPELDLTPILMSHSIPNRFRLISVAPWTSDVVTRLVLDP